MHLQLSLLYVIFTRPLSKNKQNFKIFIGKQGQKREKTISSKLGNSSMNLQQEFCVHFDPVPDSLKLECW